MAHKCRDAFLALAALFVLLGGSGEVRATLLRIPEVLELRQKEEQEAPIQQTTVRELKSCLQTDAQGRMLVVPCVKSVQNIKKPKAATPDRVPAQKRKKKPLPLKRN